MPTDLSPLIERAVAGGIQSSLWVVIQGTLISGAFVAYVAAYLAKRAEHRAIREDFKQLSDQLAEQTRISKGIEAEFQKGINTHAERFRKEFSISQQLWGRLKDFETLARKELPEKGLKTLQQETGERTEALQRACDEAADRLLICIEQNEPFFADEIAQE